MLCFIRRLLSWFYKLQASLLPLAPPAAAGTPGVSGVSPWAQFEDDCGEKTSPVAGGGLQWGGGAQGP